MRLATGPIMLANDDKIKLKQQLEEEIEELKLSIFELKKLLKPVSPDNAIGRLSRMDALEMQSVNTTKLQNQQHQVQALVRLANNDEFGLCFECGEAINLDRLKLKPESEYCVRCQQMLDQR